MPLATIAVLGGSGRHGRGIAQRLARAGARVIVGSRDPARAETAVAEWPVPPGAVSCATYDAAIASAGIVVLAVPFESVDTLVDAHYQQFTPQTLVIDVSVPIRFADGNVSLLDVPEGSAAQHVKSRLPAHVRVAVAFKTVPAHLLGDVDRPLECDEFICGDSQEARSDTIALVETIQGLRAIDIGPLTRARSIEHMTLIAIAVNRRNKIHDARYRVVGL